MKLKQSSFSTIDSKIYEEQSNHFILRFFLVIYGVLMSLACLTILFQSYTLPLGKFLMIFSAIFLLCILIMGYILMKSNIMIDKNQVIFFVLSVICIGLILRILAKVFLQTQPVSDFSTPHNFYVHYKRIGGYQEFPGWSNADSYQLYYARFPGWYPYMRLIFLIYDVFGINILYIQILNWLLYIGTGWLIFLIGKQMFNHVFALLAVCGYVFNPSLIVYTNITTPDHLSVFFILLTIFFWLKMEQALSNTYLFSDMILSKHGVKQAKSIEKAFCPLHKNKGSVYIYASLMILSAVFVNCFKPLSIFFVIAFICGELVFRVLPNIHQWKTFISVVKKNILRWFMVVLMSVILNATQTELINHSIYNMLKMPTVNATPIYLMAAFSVDETGEYSNQAGTQSFIKVIKKHDNNYPKAMEELKVLAKKQIKENSPYLLNILKAKFKSIFAGEGSYWDFSSHSLSEPYTEAVRFTLTTPFIAGAQAYMLIIYLLSAVGAFTAAFAKEVPKGVVMNALVVLGYTLVLLLSVVQGRYKALVVPSMCLIAAYGFNRIVNFRFIQNLKSRGDKDSKRNCKQDEIVVNNKMQ
nr:glycosyltransferase family 39 protein [Maliibacterium massiliense]